MGNYKEGDQTRLPFQSDQTTSVDSQKQQGWYSRPHEDLVRAFRGFINEREQMRGIYKKYFPPENVIRTELDAQAKGSQGKRLKFFAELRVAWDALAIDRYDPYDADQAASYLNTYSYKPYSREIRTSITLPDPLQVKIIDALTDAVGIPHRRGQAEIPIPEKFRGNNYWQWLASPQYKQEYHKRLARMKQRQGEK